MLVTAEYCICGCGVFVTDPSNLVCLLYPNPKIKKTNDSWSTILVRLPKITTETWKPYWFCYLLPACHFGNPNIVKNYNMPDHEIFNHILTIQRSMSKVCTTKGSAYCYHPVSIAFLMSQFWFYSLFLAWLVTTKMLFPK